MKTHKPLTRKTYMKRSRMKTKSKPKPTRAEWAYMGRVKAAGCLACWKNHWRKNPGYSFAAVFDWIALPPCEAHHPKDGNRRRGRAEVFGLCLWHHQGDPVDVGGSIKRATEQQGPSLHHDARSFHAEYGTDDELLAFQAELLKLTEGR